MRKITRYILTAVIVLLVPVMLLCFAFLLPPQYDETYLAGLQDKTERLKTVKGQKIILIGGSGAAFDVRSDLLEQELPGYTVVNYGLYAGLGTTVMLELAEPYVRQGDLIVFLPEQSGQTLSTYFDAKSLWQAEDGALPPLLSLGAKEQKAMVGAFGRFAADKMNLYLSGTKPKGEKVYARTSFNAYGDIACRGREHNIMPEGYDPNMLIAFDPDLPTDDFFSIVNTFSEKCRKKGAELYYCFCPMNASAVSAEELEHIGDYTSKLTDRLNCSVLGTAEEAIMEQGWFFDTNYHLNEAGQIVYTAWLSGQLKTVTGNRTSVSIELPSMPESDSAHIWDGDNSDEEYFLYEPYSDGFRITGLTEQGKGRNSLILPAMHNGLPVRSFTSSVFSYNQVIRTIFVSRNIVWIPDDSFLGCIALEKIILENPEPETCSVGQNLLNGTDAVITVPAEAYSSYATNYFWAMHVPRMETEK